MTQTKYLTTAETAKLIRAELKEQFPGVKFGVRCDHGSINIDWTDGPTQRTVDAVVQMYRGKDFDGMIDMAVYRRHWMTPQGEVFFAETPGSVGSGGVLSPDKAIRPHDDAVPVSLGVDYVFTNRRYSRRMLERGIAWYTERYPDHTLRVEEWTDHKGRARYSLDSDDKQLYGEDTRRVLQEVAERDGPRGPAAKR